MSHNDALLCNIQSQGVSRHGGGNSALGVANIPTA